jgi:hypothetical protein
MCGVFIDAIFHGGSNQGVNDNGDKFFTGVVDTSDKQSFANISANFRKNSKQSHWDTQRPWGQ